jgi:hypothetical protein
MNEIKKIRITQSEIDNAEKSYGTGREYTIIRRPQPGGKYLIASINLETNKIITSEIADTKDDVRKAVHEVNRWMDKAYGGGPMSHKSRRRDTKD